MASSSTLPLTNISNFFSAQLDSTNFLIWKFQIESTFISTDLIGYVNGMISAPPKDLLGKDGNNVSNPAFGTWQKQDRFVCNCTNATLSPAIAHQALGCTNASELWLSLEELYMQQSRARKSLLRRQRQTAQKGSSTIPTYLNTIKTITDSLAAIAEPVSDSDMNFERTHEKRLQHVTSSPIDMPSIGSETALFFGTSKGGYNRNNNGRSGNNNNRRNKTHSNTFSSPVFNNSAAPIAAAVPPNNFTQVTRSAPKCQICAKMGHTAAKCRFRYAASRNSNLNIAFGGLHLQQQSVAPQTRPSRPMADSSSMASRWIPDLGAASHMSFDTALLQNMQPHSDSDQVLIGDGSANGEQSSIGQH